MHGGDNVALELERGAQFAAGHAEVLAENAPLLRRRQEESSVWHKHTHLIKFDTFDLQLK